jgi:hypothetical protein
MGAAQAAPILTCSALYFSSLGGVRLRVKGLEEEVNEHKEE